ncbi:hypothetical protein TTHNP4_00349 (plasmid) [Thermus thermophilus]|uniref:Photosynthesis system II assembly factor Ycf48/Hcf136-like domain-containing protein n=2 Tax=Thermus thermophilus TaxID=274 RepID=A0A3P4AVU7_THETH|nr:hypothetical protein [Thermus thermophilus]AFH39993.1 hypothetical protein TtJL18_2155 [Thermus thermophilus JL-18]VCU54940.1 hypothetical protein TTHNP4_00349 [Thermus thermophilus]
MEGRGAGRKVGRAALVLLFAALITGAASWTEGPGPFRVRTFVDEIDAGGWLHDMAYGAGVFVVVGPFRILVSKDGVHWKKIHAPARMNAVEYTEVGFLAVGNAGTLMASKDGWDWKRYKVGRDLEWDLFGVAYGGGWYFVAANEGVILASRNLRDWVRLLEDPYMTGMVYGNGRLVVGSLWKLHVVEPGRR